MTEHGTDTDTTATDTIDVDITDTAISPDAISHDGSADTDHADGHTASQEGSPAPDPADGQADAAPASRMEALITAHVQHILGQLVQPETIDTESAAFFDWMRDQPLSRWLSLEKLQGLFQQQTLNQPASGELVEEATAIVQNVLDNPINQQTPLQELITDHTVTQMAKLIARQRTLRENMIEKILGNPAYGQMLSQTISIAVTDYMSNSVGKKMPGVGGLMKLGRSAYEKVTDSSLDQALENYLKRNIENLIETSQRKLMEQMTDDRVEQFILDSWKRGKSSKIVAILDTRGKDTQTNSEDAPEIAQNAWDHLRQTRFVQVHVMDGLQHWYERNSEKSPVVLLEAIGVTESLIREEIHMVFQPLVQLLTESDYFRQRIEQRLREFYYLPHVQDILA